MGTFSDSKINKARKRYACCINPTHIINAGDPYLRYKLGQRNDRVICIQCAKAKEMSGTALRYDCAAVRELIANAVL